LEGEVFTDLAGKQIHHFGADILLRKDGGEPEHRLVLGHCRGGCCQEQTAQQHRAARESKTHYCSSQMSPACCGPPVGRAATHRRSPSFTTMYETVRSSQWLASTEPELNG